MKLKIYILLFLIVSNTIICQTKDVFKVKTIFKLETEIDAMIKEIDSLNSKSVFFEDDKYIVYPECRGEWGGAITFKNKKSKKEFICESTCPIIINRFKNKYIITNSLNHLLPSTEILEIINPEKLEAKEKYKRYNFEKLGKQGAQKLIDVYHYSALGSFVNNEKLYHIVCDDNKTFIAEIVDEKFVFVQELAAARFWTYNSNIFKTEGKITIVINNFKIKGCIEINGNEITFFRTK